MLRLNPQVLLNRPHETDLVAKFFSDPGASLLYIVGSPGIGKSALARGALKLAKENVSTSWLNCAGLSSTQFLTDVVDELNLDRDLIDDQTRPYKARFLKALTTADAAIVVLDDLQHLLDKDNLLDSEMQDAIDCIGKFEHKVRALVTTRHLPRGCLQTDGVRIMHLKGLDAAASKDLLTKLAPENTRHHLMNLSSAVLDRLQGNPKNIELAAISLRDGRLDRLLENATAETDIARHLAEHIIQTLSPDE